MHVVVHVIHRVLLELHTEICQQSRSTRTKQVRISLAHHSYIFMTVTIDGGNGVNVYIIDT